MKYFYILIKSWAVYVKEANFFIHQGGLSEEWGRHWIRVRAASIEDARKKGEELRENQQLQS